MSRQYFGTDGVRGRVGGEPMTVEFALRLASAAARVLATGSLYLVGAILAAAPAAAGRAA